MKAFVQESIRQAVQAAQPSTAAPVYYQTQPAMPPPAPVAGGSPQAGKGSPPVPSASYPLGTVQQTGYQPMAYGGWAPYAGGYPPYYPGPAPVLYPPPSPQAVTQGTIAPLAGVQPLRPSGPDSGPSAMTHISGPGQVLPTGVSVLETPPEVMAVASHVEVSTGTEGGVGQEEEPMDEATEAQLLADDDLSKSAGAAPSAKDADGDPEGPAVPRQEEEPGDDSL